MVIALNLYSIFDVQTIFIKMIAHTLIKFDHTNNVRYSPYHKNRHGKFHAKLRLT